MQQKDLAVIILAAGKGTRMKSSLAKVLLPLAGHPLLHYTLDLSSKLNPVQTIVVVGHQADQVQQAFADRGVEFVLQHEQLGTGHAAKQAKEKLENFKGLVLVLCGDMPLIRPDTLLEMVAGHRASGAKCTVLTLKSDGLHDFGRIIRDEKGLILKIVEFKDASDVEKKVDEFNSGVYCFDKDLFFKGLCCLSDDNVQEEYYLTDTLEYAMKNGYPVASVQIEDTDEIFGINSPEDLKRAEKLLKK